MALFYADENFDYPVAQRLRALGHDVVTVQEAGEQGGLEAGRGRTLFKPRITRITRMEGKANRAAALLYPWDRCNPWFLVQ
jgi:hypothetical protein